MKIASKEYVVRRMTSLMIAPKKKFSQNFLIDESVVEESIEALSIEKDDALIEVGPGLGALTERLLESGNPLFAYEIDPDLCAHLRERFSVFPTFHLYEQDFLKADLSPYRDRPVKVISNVPYHITTPIIEKIITSGIQVSTFEFMVQREVYSRIKAGKGSKDYLPLNIFIDYVGVLECVKKVGKDKFLPSPNVDSVILKIDFNRPRVEREWELLFFDVVRACFFQRRKTVQNNLIRFLKDKEKVGEVLQKSGIDPEKRGEELGKEEYLRLSRNILNIR